MLLIFLFVIPLTVCTEEYDYSEEDYDEEEEIFKDEESSSEESSSEEEDDSNTEDVDAENKEKEIDDMVKDCMSTCNIQAQLSNSNINEESQRSYCRLGCEAQKTSFMNLQVKYPNTAKLAPEMLLGTAVDLCWDKCSFNIADVSLRPICVSACSIMRKLQKKEIQESKVQADKSADKSEIVLAGDNTVNKDDNENIITEYKDDKEDILSKEELFNIVPSLKDFVEDVAEDEVENPAPESDLNSEIVEGQDDKQQDGWSYVWVRTWPEEDTFNYNLASWMQQMFAELDRFNSQINVNDEDLQTAGQRGDNLQFNWPSYPARSISDIARASAMSSNEDAPGIYEQVAASLQGMKDNVERTFDTPGFKENLFYILLGLSGMMMLMSVFNSMMCPKENPPMEDHYYLPPGEQLPVKLPTYEECIKADQQLVVGLTEQEYKINLNLPVVAMPLGSDEKKAIDEADQSKDDTDKNATA